MRELFRQDKECLEVPASASVAMLLEVIRTARPESSRVWESLAVAVNQEYVTMDRTLHEGDEVALLPPVSGEMQRQVLRLRRAALRRTLFSCTTRPASTTHLCQR